MKLTLRSLGSHRAAERVCSVVSAQVLIGLEFEHPSDEAEVVWGGIESIGWRTNRRRFRRIRGPPAGAPADARLLSGVCDLLSFISVAIGIFATYDDVLVNAGPVGIWLWIIAAVGQTLVALVVAQFAARIPDRAR